MEDNQKEVAIDVGGGEGEFLLRLAKENPEKTYIILDPLAKKVRGAPENLHFVRWRVNTESMLPFLPEKIDEAHINFLLGEIKEGKRVEDGHEVDYFEDQAGQYQKLLKDLKNVLKPGAILRITDTKDCINIIEKLLRNENYSLVGGPKKVSDEEKTFFSQYFFKAFREWGRSEEESHILPMEIEAKWEGKS
jgi:tRNA G46 methylase TrmB